MPPFPEVSLMHETVRNLTEGYTEAETVLRHEGLKRAVEQGLFWAGTQKMGRLLLQVLSEGITFVTDPRLETNLGGLALDGPTGIAAGWDKTGKTILAWQSLGANHITIGGVSLYPQTGKQMPRLYTFDDRVGDHGKRRSLNSYGFYNQGTPKTVYNIAKQKETGKVHIPVIIQATVNKEMYEPGNLDMIPKILTQTVRQLMTVADAIEVGISSPNTLGMREAQTEEFLYSALMAAKEASGDLPFGFKGDGDGGEGRLDMYCRVALRTGANYIALINTTAKQHIKARYGAAHLPGGLAGADPEYQEMAVNAVRYVYEAIGDKVDIMGMGGINSDTQQQKLIFAGASATGVNSSVREHGAKAVSSRDIGTSEYLDLQGMSSLDETIGVLTIRGPKKRAS